MEYKRRLIYADHAEELIKNYGKEAISDGRSSLDPVDDIVSLAKGIDLIPSVDAVHVVHGEWLPTNDENKKRCSRCDVIHLIAQYPAVGANLCPACGAKMGVKGHD